MRKTLEVVDLLKKVGIGFVPIPIMGEEDKIKLDALMVKRLDQLEKEA